MEGASTTVIKKFKKYWRRRGYVKLNGSKRRRRAEAELGPTPTARRRLWRLRGVKRPKLKFKFKLRWRNPKKFFVWLRDAYVNMMLKLSNSAVISGYGGYGGDAITLGIAAMEKPPVKEYDEKMLVEIYKTFMMSQTAGLYRQ